MDEKRKDRVVLSTKTIAIYAVLTALIMATTYLIKIPTVATEGYVNPGDAFVLFCGVAFGPFAGFFCGGVGSCLADLAAGYAHWILPTFVIKGFEGFFSGLVFYLVRKTKLNRFINAGISVVPAGFLMVLGYFCASTVMKGSAQTALLSVPANCLQATFGIVVSMLLLFALSQIKSFSYLVGKNYFFDYPKKNKGASEQGKEGEESRREGHPGE